MRYDQRRKQPGFEGFSDLDAVYDDAVNVRKGVLGLGAK